MRKSLLALTLLGVSIQSASAVYVDLTTANTSGTINGASFVWVNQQSTGTGVIDPFLRIQKNTTETGFNTDANNVLDDKSGTRSILVSDFGTVQLNGQGSYIRFLLDINESRGGNDELLSLDKLKVYVGDTPNRTDLTSGSIVNVYDMGAGNSVGLNFALNPGSGAGDMYFYVPSSLILGAVTATNKYLFLESSFGGAGGGFTSSDGFEEWARVDGAAPVPEPTAYAFLLSLLSSGVVLYLRRSSASE